MHCLFLGISKWIIKLWIDEAVLSSQDLELMDKWAKKIRVPSNIGCIPYKIAMGDGFLGFTADQ